MQESPIPLNAYLNDIAATAREAREAKDAKTRAECIELLSRQTSALELYAAECYAAAKPKRKRNGYFPPLAVSSA